jgi:hypothetical protein
VAARPAARNVAPKRVSRLALDIIRCRRSTERTQPAGVLTRGGRDLAMTFAKQTFGIGLVVSSFPLPDPPNGERADEAGDHRHHLQQRVCPLDEVRGAISLQTISHTEVLAVTTGLHRLL